MDEPTAALVAETTYAAGLLNSTNGPEPVFLPTTEYDVWRARDTAPRWISAGLGLAGHDPPAQPGQPARRARPRDHRAGPGRRARHDPGAAPPGARRCSPSCRPARPRPTGTRCWPCSPGTSRAGPRASVPLAEAILAEADLLGVTAAGGAHRLHPHAARRLGRGRRARAGARAARPGRPLPRPARPHRRRARAARPPALGVELGLIADLESTGGAHVYRITERSVRRALDAGRTGRQLARSSPSTRARPCRRRCAT